MKTIILGIVFIIIVVFMVSFFHGRWQEIIYNRLHDDCFLCEIYKIQMIDDVSFNIREVNRKVEQ